MEERLNFCPLRDKAIHYPRSIAFQGDVCTLSYLELDSLVGSISSQLSFIVKGEILVCIAKNSLELLVLQLSCIRNSIIFCPLNPNFTSSELLERIKQIDAKFIWAEKELSHLFDTLSLDFTLIKNPDDFKESKEDHKRAQIQIDSYCASNIIFTSGSSGLPKAAVHSFSNHFYSALGSLSVIHINNGDRNLLSLPQFHIGGYALIIRSILAGACIVQSSQKISIDLLKDHKVTHLSLVATQLQRLLADPDFCNSKLSLKHILLGGSSFSDELLNQLKKRDLTFHLSYGLTEMSSQVATSTNDTKLKLLPFRTLQIIDGEICVSGKTKFMGYIDFAIDNCKINKSPFTIDNGKINKDLIDPLAIDNCKINKDLIEPLVIDNCKINKDLIDPLVINNCKINKDLIEPLVIDNCKINKDLIDPLVIDNGNWFHTKDLGIFKDHVLQVTGRADRQFISGGENIQPEEIEKKILELKGVLRVCVVSVMNQEFGQRPVAFIETNFSDFNEFITILLAELRGKLTSYKLPIAFYNWPDDLPVGLKVSIKQLEIIARKNSSRN